MASLRHAPFHPESRYSAIDGWTTRHAGYVQSQKHCKKIDEPFGWAKTVAGMAQTMYRGVERVRSWLIHSMAANNLVRLTRLLATLSGNSASGAPIIRVGPGRVASGCLPVLAMNRFHREVAHGDWLRFGHADDDIPSARVVSAPRHGWQIDAKASASELTASRSWSIASRKIFLSII